MSVSDFISLLGGVALFLFGMSIMGDALKKVAGNQLELVLYNLTSTPIKGVLLGTGVTAVIQSSSATSVMVVGFVNSGLMTLRQAINVIMGANVGTTFTAWIISIFGGQVNVNAFILPLIGIATPFLFSSKSNYKSIAEFLIGFSFLFLGLQLISENVPELDANALEFLAHYADMGFASVVIFVLVGIVITMIIQSSAASFAIVMIMCGKGWITFEMGCAMVLGSNIGTTITPILASLGGNSAAKKAALGHLLFNCFGTVWALIFIYPLISLVITITAKIGPGNPVIAGAAAMSFGLSVFHTIFNLINVVIMIWLTEYYVKICNFLIKPKHKEEDEFQLKYISRGMLNAAELNIAQAQREIEVYADRVNRMFGMVKSLRHIKPETEEFNKLFSRIGKYEEISDRMEIEIANYLNRVVDGRLSYEGKMRISSMLSIVSEIESIADSCNNLARTRQKSHSTR